MYPTLDSAAVPDLVFVRMDPFVTLAFSVYSSKGVYALLLGSGISRAAQIPTGWEIVEDLIGKVARLSGKEDSSDPAGWYRTVYGKEPTYSDLLEQLAKTPPERTQLLRSYFEPTSEQRERGEKLPTAAHRAIARLVSKGYIKVILTTNFDRLLENALDSEGVRPAVLSTTDAIQGSLPVQHTSCCVIKVHGDYMDTRIRNTPSELAKYDKPVDDLLDRVLDEFGLIVCGWSAEWDSALRAAIERCPNRRFTTYWCSKGSLNAQAEQLAKLRKAEVLSIESADQFFVELEQKIASLESLSASHPLSSKLAAATIKRYVSNPQRKIDLHDLVLAETERIVDAISKANFSLESIPYTEISNYIARYENLTEILQTMFAVGCYWGEDEHISIWQKSLIRLTNPPQFVGSYVVLLANLRLYPALLLLYIGGIVAVVGGKYRTLRALLNETTARDDRERTIPLMVKVNAGAKIFDTRELNQVPDMENTRAPMSKRLFSAARESVREFLPDDRDYQEAFDRFEYLLALSYIQITAREWAPLGLFATRDPFDNEKAIEKVVQAELQRDRAEWPPLKGGLFEGDFEVAMQTKKTFDQFLSRVREQWGIF
jgi:SIR2-like domain